jgi:hypothetical protein
MLLASLTDVNSEANTSNEHESGEEGEIMEGDVTAVVQEAGEVVEYASAVHPSNQLLLQFDQVLTQRLLVFFASWLQLPSVQKWDNDRMENMYSWIFSLLSRLEKPLYMDASATVRDIYRYLCIQRGGLAERAISQAAGALTSEDSGPPPKRTRENLTNGNGIITGIDQLCPNVQKALAFQNTVIVICGKYFGQEEAEGDIVTSACSVSEGNDNGNVEEKKKKKTSPVVVPDLSAKYPTLVPDEDLYISDKNDNATVQEDLYKMDTDGHGDY